MKYGHYSPDGREFIITDPATPRPWCNYLTNGRYCALTSHTGGGYSFVESSGYNRITRAHPAEMVFSDRPGRYVYVRDRESGEFWTLNWQPVQRPPTRWEARHAPGITRISTETAGIAGELTYFVPLDDDVEIWQIKLTNPGERERRLTVFAFVEWALGSYGFDLLETSFANLFKSVRWEGEALVAQMRLWNVGHRPARPHLSWGRHAFLAASFPVQAYDGLREVFIGPYRTLANPVVIENGECTNSHGTGRDVVGVLQGEFTLAPGESTVFNILLGAPVEKKEIKSLVAKYCRDSHGAPAVGKATGQALARVQAYWDDYLGRNITQTPDEAFNHSVNIWNKYQAWVTFHWSRMSSYYIGGGSMIGLRDSSQDLLGILPMDPPAARAKLLEILRHQFHDGGTLHNWDPITNTGPRTGHSDDALWLILATANYLKETGDFAFLDEQVIFYDEGTGTVWDHLQASLSYTLHHFSPRGLPLMQAADWNDALDQVGEEGRGESVMVAEFLVWMYGEMAEMARASGRTEAVGGFLQRRQELISRINELCWDGEWYIRGTTDEGEVFGSKKNRYGQIYLNAQSWAVLSGVATGERAKQCMDAAYARLDTPYGPAIFLPAYQEPDDHIGLITLFAPGVKENGTIFNHPVTWAIIAETINRNGERAYAYWRKAAVDTRLQDPDHYKAEPYAYAEYVYGPDSPFFGQGEFTWTTGTAAWMWRACFDWILGVRPEYEGLRVDPVIPARWEEFTVQRVFRGATYVITVKNPARVNSGVKTVTLDGHPHAGNLLPVFGDGRAHTVEVIMG